MANGGSNASPISLIETALPWPIKKRLDQKTTNAGRHHQSCRFSCHQLDGWSSRRTKVTWDFNFIRVVDVAS